MAWRYLENTGIAAWFWLMPPGLITLMLVASAAFGQSVLKDRPRSSLRQPANLEVVVRLGDRPRVTEPTFSRFNTALVGEPSPFRWWQTTSQPPLPPASVLSLQTNLHKYLNTWPAPGARVSRDEPPDGELADEDLM